MLRQAQHEDVGVCWRFLACVSSQFSGAPGERPAFRAWSARIFTRYISYVLVMVNKGSIAMGAHPGISLTDQAYARLEELIVTLQIPPGQAISESELCEQTGFGRTPVREALQRLSRQKLVNILPRRGMFITEINVETQLYLLELRREVEQLMVRLAARRRTEEERFQFGEIASAMEQAAEARDDEAFLALDKAFNDLVGRTCRNPFARASMEQWNPLARRFWYQHHQQVGDLSRMAALHADIAWAIGAGDEAVAGEACDLLMNYLTGFTRAALDAEHA